jgi:hypothetical protein
MHPTFIFSFVYKKERKKESRYVNFIDKQESVQGE